MLFRSVILSSFVAAASFAATATPQVTFTKDVLPVLQNRCQGCHRPGEVAPMSFLSYKDTRPWAKAIRQAVLTRKMPPWFADPHYGKFLNDRTLSQHEIDTLVAWSDGGAVEGDSKDAPKPVEFVEGWGIGKPDMVFTVNEFSVPAKGTIEYQYVVIPTGFTEDKWVQAAEARPGNRAVTHHIIAFIRPPGSKWMQDAKPFVPFVPPSRKERRRKSDADDGSEQGPGNELLVGYAPGIMPVALKPGQAKLVKAGTDLILQMHYTANGKEATDRSSIGLIFAKETPTERVLTTAAMNGKFVIPPGDANLEVKSHLTLEAEARLIDFMPHMHLRGKDFEYRVVYPDGKTETLLRVPKYDFNWQLYYFLADPPVLPAGTRIECTAHFDNSANNPANPDAKSEVRWGDQSWEEMMIGWFDVAIKAGQDPIELYKSKAKKAAD